ncbi:MAG: hypothetical protein FWD31_03805 [Planctomycetaceae bacterium]|nr:hypothetical protein [Planctomycetaceae bacterium]
MRDILWGGLFLPIDASQRDAFHVTLVTTSGLRSAGRFGLALWGAVGDESHPYNVYFFRRDGTRASLESIVKNYPGILRCDAHTVYDDIFEPETPKPGTSRRQGGRRDRRNATLDGNIWARALQFAFGEQTCCF